MHIVVIIACLVWALNAKETLFKAIPLSYKGPQEKIKLGERLFHDPLLSKDGSVSCATCHPIANYGVDNLRFSFGVDGQKGERNTPTVLNSGYNFSQFWDGRVRTLEEQVFIPITNPNEMGETIASVINKLKKNATYKSMFMKVYKDEVNEKNLADAIAEYERSLITPDSDFDRYLRGDYLALNKQEKRGFELFKKKGCVACHNGRNIGGNLYQKSGVFDKISNQNKPDLGRYHVTNKEYDKFYFRVPSLRNVEMTAPYFHDGSVGSLETAVKVMAKAQLGRDLSDEDVKAIVSFLKTLTGKISE